VAAQRRQRVAVGEPRCAGPSGHDSSLRPDGEGEEAEGILIDRVLVSWGGRVGRATSKVGGGDLSSSGHR
jgi:hypothetical protein